MWVRVTECVFPVHVAKSLLFWRVLLLPCREIVKAPSFALIAPLAAPTRGGTLLEITGSNFKDRGTVKLVKGDTVLTCATPPFGEEGNLTDVYYARDGKMIRVCVCHRGSRCGLSLDGATV